jgi:hypothetical protein
MRLPQAPVKTPVHEQPWRATPTSSFFAILTPFSGARGSEPVTYAHPVLATPAANASVYGIRTFGAGIPLMRSNLANMS